MRKKFDFGNKTTKVRVIDCLDCENYYTGSCDGNAGGCKAYTPVRKITMADDLKTIKRRQNVTFGLLSAVYIVECILCFLIGYCLL